MWNGEEYAGCSSGTNQNLNGRKRPHDDCEESITLQEVLAFEEHLEDDARALLGSANDSVCTYPEGYTPRQMVYACKTCNSPTQPAAICYGCSIHCHNDHDLIELYTKRRVCCDCGNSKFKNRCTLFPEKQPLNKRNQYNHNYAGLYCICERPYPPIDFDDDGDMVQCIICEDWYHINHLDRTSADLARNEEVVCGKCAVRIDFLKYYSDNHYEELEDEGSCKLKILMNKYALKQEGNTGDTEVDSGLCGEQHEKLSDLDMRTEQKCDSSSLTLKDEGETSSAGGNEGTNEQMESGGGQEQNEASGSMEKKKDARGKLMQEQAELSDEVKNDRTNKSLEEKGEESIGLVGEMKMQKDERCDSSINFDGIKRKYDTKEEYNTESQTDEDKKTKSDDRSKEILSNDCINEKCYPKEEGRMISNNKREELSQTNGRHTVEKLKTLLFSSSTWRQRLCRCNDCLSMYEANDVEFLLDVDDTLASYTKDRYTNRPSEEVEKKRIIDGLISLAGRDGAILLMQGYEKMKNKILEMLLKKTAEGSTVTKEDIAEAFRELREETKLPRVE